MKSLLIILGAIFLVVGAIFYFMPEQGAAATTTTISPDGTGSEVTSTRTSAASLYIPWPATLALLIIGLALFVLGLIVPDKTIVHKRESDAEYDVSTTEEVDLDTGRRRTTIRDVHRSARRL